MANIECCNETIKASALTIEVKSGMLIFKPYIATMNKNAVGKFPIINEKTAGLFTFLSYIGENKDYEPEIVDGMYIHKGIHIEGILNKTIPQEQTGDDWVYVHVLADTPTILPVVTYKNGKGMSGNIMIINKEYYRDGKSHIECLVNVKDLKLLVLNTMGMSYKIDFNNMSYITTRNCQNTVMKLTINGQPLERFIKEYRSEDGYTFHAVDINGQYIVIDKYNFAVANGVFKILDKGLNMKFKQMPEGECDFEMDIKYRPNTTVLMIRKAIMKKLYGDNWLDTNLVNFEFSTLEGKNFYGDLEK